MSAKQYCAYNAGTDRGVQKERQRHAIQYDAHGIPRQKTVRWLGLVAAAQSELGADYNGKARIDITLNATKEVCRERERAEQSRAEQSRAEQSRAEQSRAEQSRARSEIDVMRGNTLANIFCIVGFMALENNLEFQSFFFSKHNIPRGRSQEFLSWVVL